MTRAVFPGSFDPMTNGHLEILGRVAPLFDEVRVAVLVNPDKRPLFSVEERMALMREVVRPWPNVRVDAFSGLLVDYVRREGVDVILRGLRSAVDFEAEMQMAQMNRHLYGGAVTLFVPSAPEYAFVSSSLVKQVAAGGGALEGLVPPPVASALMEKFQTRGRK
ncbi:pantetheine-phosphate adenylyltransferase [Alicyclobacillus macrosporangiidus]|uniref:Phosphopantetheine adenylyltransferase n=1 Tax=Alicyclobacillus macrosporangiidus TaxID=392015 RepID=A0A1I7H7E5_9BACL|nr:pantetheine-phosphate adenylyltransferase [Alicyclobacillus macrosporangiidus]SFU56601.1 Phosphopantetheine adenylyltransferase [Alicyclobacillus macrosporangiidus]